MVQVFPGNLGRSEAPRQLRKILEACGRGHDYVEVSLDGDIRYNPLNNSLDAYAHAFNIASIITAIWAMRQLFAYRAQDHERKLSGIVLEVKGDLCRT